ncbi:MAG: arylsulfatase [Opitutaceae bacterium]|jgi:arylsulfatase|nr:arylsulfatase [Opitutaceae bacterium]
MITQKMTQKMLAGLPFVMGVSAGCLVAQESSQAPRPNIVVILADDLGYSDLGCFGGEIATPNLDRLAQNGVALTQFYNQARCCPTRAALMTGRYPHQVGIGEMIDGYAAAARANAGSPAYQDHLSPQSPTMAEVLRNAGYRTMMAGKWHLGKRPSEWPVRRGFDRSFVQIDGAMNYYGGDSGDGPRAPMAIDGKEWTPPRDGFYSTDAFAQHAIGFIDEATRDHAGKPFFLYLPFNAPHWPLQAPDEDIARYKGKYDAGWDAIREQRLARMKQFGIVPKNQKMSPMDRGASKPWDELASAGRVEWARRMEVYAAQITRMDQAIGQVLAALERHGIGKNTLVIFLSDNGGAAEDPNRGQKNAPIGHRDSYRGYARPWASVSNTPWKRHKVSAYEGGVSTPLLARWPAGIDAAANGKLIRDPAHVTDLFPTFVALSGARYPETDTVKLEGRNITAMLKGNPGDSDRLFCWEHEGNRAIRMGKWKLVSCPPAQNTRHITAPWELYDLEDDRIESKDLASRQPGIVKKLAAEYDAWAARCGVIEFSKIVPEPNAGASKNKKGKGGKKKT